MFETGNTNLRGRLSTVDLNKVACFGKKENNIFSLKMRQSKLFRMRR
jgi:hypothetical protein